MKKILSVLMALAIFCGLLAAPAYAAGDGSITMSSASGCCGDTVTLSVNLNTNPGLVTMTIRVSYDTSALQLTNVSNTGLLVGAQLNSSYGSPYTISWVDGATTTNNTKTGTIASFTFKILDGAKVGSNTVRLQFVDSYDTDYQANGFSASSGKITVKCNHSYGSWSNAGNGQHSRTCTICTDKESANHTWNSGKVTKQSTCKEEGIMTYVCADCKGVKTESVAKLITHTYDHACDADCNVCGATRQIVHTYKTAWSTDKTNHWQECSVCMEKTSVDTHTPGPETTAAKAQTCTVCSYEIAPALGVEETTEPAKTKQEFTKPAEITEETTEPPETTEESTEPSEIAEESEIIRETTEPTVTTEATDTTEATELTEPAKQMESGSEKFPVWAIAIGIIAMGIITLLFVINKKKT